MAVGQLGFQHLPRKTNHTIEWGAQLMGHVSQKFGFYSCRFLSALFGNIEFNVLNLKLFKGFPEIGRRLVDTVLHFDMVFGERYRHRVDAFFQRIQLAVHFTFNPHIQMAATNAVDHIFHVSDWASHIVHQARSKYP
ncbi:Uncharacterised protein [Vibrio cholerae]|nr:Uncharacterised protein [Vibrio cholerae]CSB24755.1 Uncharacterised protein [Vibrio cholerae]CSB27144.1 Uncharacterised protein [Vibrio cholerae]CSB35709.1 Uncharacterised protein [Vibrio cholerae]CSB37395.1 Uncharacterised protein [Vibrio cholerae]